MLRTYLRIRFLALTAILCAFLALPLAGCSAPPANATSLQVAVTIAPLKAIIEELAGERLEVIAVLPPGASPHTYEIRPSDARASEQALALFYVGPGLDEWAARLPARERVAVFELVPARERRVWSAAEACTDHGHDHGHGGDHAPSEYDPHFWSDPLTVRAVIPAIARELTRLDPAGAAVYARNAEDFAARLERLHLDLAARMTPYRGTVVALFHPSWNYYLDRYGIEVGAYIEPDPGKEVSPRYLKGVLDTIEAREIRAVFTEPQLPKRPAEVIAEATGRTLYELDPIGGVSGRERYDALVLYNAAVLEQALQ